MTPDVLTEVTPREGARPKVPCRPGPLTRRPEIAPFAEKEEMPVSETNPSRFTIDGSDALERQLNEICRTIAESVQELIPKERFEALLLGGGYGRGEGGVLGTASGD